MTFKKKYTKKNPVIGSSVIIIILLAYWVFVNFISPITPFFRDYDPEFQYFLNSLSVFKGQNYYYSDHPGTPVESIGSIILAITYPIIARSIPEFIYFHLQNPELFFYLSSAFLTLSSIGCALLFYRIVLSNTPRNLRNVLLATILALMFYAIHPLSFSTLTLWSHASFNFPFGTLYLLAFYKKIAQSETEFSVLSIIVWGFLAGVLSSVMIYFVTWAIGMLTFFIIFYRMKKIAWKNILGKVIVMSFSSILGFFVGMFPALNRIPYFLMWIIKLFTHQGMYGDGPVGITTISILWSNLLSMIKTAPLIIAYCFLFFLCLLFVFYRLFGKVHNQNLWAFALSLVVQITLLLLLALKHPGSRSFMVDRYTLPVAATLPVLAIVTLKLFLVNSEMHRILRSLIVCSVSIALVINGIYSIKDYQKRIQLISSSAASTSRAIEKYAHVKEKSVNELNVYWMYGTYSPCYSLWFADDSAANLFTKEITSICNNQLHYDPWLHSQILFVNGISKNETNTKWDIIVTRKRFLELFPHTFSGPGIIRQDIPETENGDGPIIIFTKDKN